MQAFVDFAAPGNGVAGIEGVPAALASATRFAPSVHNDGADGGTWIAVVNAGQAATDVTVSYRGTGASCPAAPVIHGGSAYHLVAGAMAVFDQRDAPGAPPPTGTSGLPTGCHAAATAELRMTDSQFNVITADCPECTQTIQPRRSYTWYPPAMPSLQGYAGSQGPAEGLGDQPLSVVFSDSAGRGGLDTSMANAIAAVPTGSASPVSLDVPTPAPQPNHLPLFLIRVSLDEDGPCPWVVSRVALPFVANSWTMP